MKARAKTHVGINNAKPGALLGKESIDMETTLCRTLQIILSIQSKNEYEFYSVRSLSRLTNIVAWSVTRRANHLARVLAAVG